MRIGCIADLHFGQQMDRNPRCDRDEETMEQVRAALRLFYSKKVGAVAVLGDLSNTSHPSIQVNRWLREFLLGMDMNVPTLVIPGNHDYNMVSGQHVLEPLSIDGALMRVFETPGVWQGCWVVPYMPGADMTAEMERGEERIVLTHALFAGGSVPTGVKLKSRVVPVPRGKFVVAGDVHGSQRFRANGSWVVYPGSLTQTRYDERGQDKGVFILDTREPESKSKFHPLPDHYRYEHVEISAMDEMPELDWSKTILDLVVTDKSLVAPAWDFIEENEVLSVRRVAVEEQIEEQPLKELGAADYRDQWAEYMEGAPKAETKAGLEIIEEELS